MSCIPFLNSSYAAAPPLNKIPLSIIFDCITENCSNLAAFQPAYAKKASIATLPAVPNPARTALVPLVYLSRNLKPPPDALAPAASLLTPSVIAVNGFSWLLKKPIALSSLLEALTTFFVNFSCSVSDLSSALISTLVAFASPLISACNSPRSPPTFFITLWNIASVFAV